MKTNKIKLEQINLLFKKEGKVFPYFLNTKKLIKTTQHSVLDRDTGVIYFHWLWFAIQFVYKIK